MPDAAEPPDPLLVLLALRPVADPLARDGRPPRDPVYRLKFVLPGLLRSAGWRCFDYRLVRPALYFEGDGEGI